MQNANDVTQERDESHDYPVSLVVTRPADTDRGQLLLRLLIVFVLGYAHQSLGGLFMGLYILVPAVAGVLLSRAPGPGFVAADRNGLQNALEWVLAAYAYLLVVTDRFPADSDSRALRFIVRSDSRSNLMNAALRPLTSLPQVVWLFVLGIAAGVCAIVSGVHLWLGKLPPAGIGKFQRDFVGCLARFFAYHASLVDTYPPYQTAVR